MAESDKQAKKQVEAPQKESPKPKPEKEDGKKSIKISQMSLAEIDLAIQETEKHMGGLWSRYGKILVARREFLLSQRDDQQRKAA